MRAIEVLRFPAVLALMLVLAGCASRAWNASIEPVAAEVPAPAHGPVVEWKTDDTFIVLAFSGGGTRSAAFAYGVLEELRDTTAMAHGRRRRLLDEVDVITSVSGGSFTQLIMGYSAKGYSRILSRSS